MPVLTVGAAAGTRGTSRARKAIELTQPLSLLELFSGDTHKDVFFIPPYQRGYEWTSAQACELLNEIYSAAALDRREDVPSYARREVFVLNSIVCTAENSDPDHAYTRETGVGALTTRTDVVDGQQRITTLMLVLSVLRSLCDRRLRDLESGKSSDSDVSQPWVKKVVSDLMTLVGTINSMMFVKLNERHRHPRLLPLEMNQNATHADPYLGPKAATEIAPFERVDEIPTASESSDVYQANFRALSCALAKRLPSLADKLQSRKQYSDETNVLSRLLEYMQASIVVIYVQPERSHAQQLFDVVNTPGQPLDPVARLRFSLYRAKVSRSVLNDLGNRFNVRDDFGAFLAISHACGSSLDEYAYLELTEDLSVPKAAPFATALNEVLVSIEGVGAEVGEITRKAQEVAKYYLDAKDIYDAMSGLLKTGPIANNELSRVLWEFCHIEQLAGGSRKRADTALSDERQRTLTAVTLWRPLVITLMQNARLPDKWVTNKFSTNDAGGSSLNAVTEWLKQALIAQLGAMLDPRRGTGQSVAKTVRTAFLSILQASRKKSDQFEGYNEAVCALRKGIHVPLYELAGQYALPAGKHLLRRVEEGMGSAGFHVVDVAGKDGWEVEHLTAQCIERDKWTPQLAKQSGIIHDEADHQFWVVQKALHRLGNLAVLERENNQAASNNSLLTKLNMISSRYLTFTGSRKYISDVDKCLRPVTFRKRHIDLASALYKIYHLAIDESEARKLATEDLDQALSEAAAGGASTQLVPGKVRTVDSAAVVELPAGEQRPMDLLSGNPVAASTAGNVSVAALAVPSAQLASSVSSPPSKINTAQARSLYVNLETTCQPDYTGNSKKLEEQFNKLTPPARAPYFVRVLVDEIITGSLSETASEVDDVHKEAFQKLRDDIGSKLAAANFVREPLSEDTVEWTLPSMTSLACPFPAVRIARIAGGYHCVSIALPHGDGGSGFGQSTDIDRFVLKLDCFVRTNRWNELGYYEAHIVPNPSQLCERLPPRTASKRFCSPAVAVAAVEKVITCLVENRSSSYSTGHPPASVNTARESSPPTARETTWEAVAVNDIANSGGNSGDDTESVERTQSSVTPMTSYWLQTSGETNSTTAQAGWAPLAAFVSAVAVPSAPAILAPLPNLSSAAVAAAYFAANVAPAELITSVSTVVAPAPATFGGGEGMPTKKRKLKILPTVVPGAQAAEQEGATLVAAAPTGGDDQQIKKKRRKSVSAAVSEAAALPVSMSGGMVPAAPGMLPTLPVPLVASGAAMATIASQTAERVVTAPSPTVLGSGDGNQIKKKRRRSASVAAPIHGGDVAGLTASMSMLPVPAARSQLSAPLVLSGAAIAAPGAGRPVGPAPVIVESSGEKRSRESLSIAAPVAFGNDVGRATSVSVVAVPSAVAVIPPVSTVFLVPQTRTPAPAEVGSSELTVAVRTSSLTSRGEAAVDSPALITALAGASTGAAATHFTSVTSATLPWSSSATRALGATVAVAPAAATVPTLSSVATATRDSPDNDGGSASANRFKNSEFAVPIDDPAWQAVESTIPVPVPAMAPFAALGNGPTSSTMISPASTWPGAAARPGATPNRDAIAGPSSASGLSGQSTSPDNPKRPRSSDGQAGAAADQAKRARPSLPGITLLDGTSVIVERAKRAIRAHEKIAVLSTRTSEDAQPDDFILDGRAYSIAQVSGAVDALRSTESEYAKRRRESGRTNDALEPEGDISNNAK